MTGQNPDKCGNDCQSNHRRYKYTGYFICNFGNRSFCGRRITYHLNDLTKGCIFSYPPCFTFDKTRLIYRRCGNQISRIFIHRNAFPCQCRLIHRSRPFYYNAVHRNIFSRTNYKNITFIHFINGHFHFHTITYQNCCLWSKLHKTF